MYYHYALSSEITQVAWLKHGTGVRYHRPVDGYMMYTNIDFEYHSHLWTTLNWSLNKPIILSMLGEENSTEGPIHIYIYIL